jgi:DNA-binding transcriptional LysR family regulator
MSYQIGEELKNGALTRILRDYETKPLPVSIIHLEGRQANAKIRSFIDLAIDRLRANPYIDHN